MRIIDKTVCKIFTELFLIIILMFPIRIYRPQVRTSTPRQLAIQSERMCTQALTARLLRMIMSNIVHEFEINTCQAHL